ncbi:hypothetical protein CTAYLR_001496 [Chrysophaeum taylorii]|uniref:SAP domain-containing protein n=1 Tax=Chrysophaeum taylorii TaxID=2483200 RepID=A0AAD7XP05_9STRA|nr:hypothetical protein CTAYLR_001496 [Chrysophaeum taylorii]
MGQKKGGRGSRGGRRHFVTSAEDLEKRNSNIEQYQKSRQARRDDESSGSEAEEEVGEEERVMQMERLREEVGELSAERKPKGVEGVIEVANPNLARKQHKKARDMEEAAPELTRREREELEKQRAAEAYRKRHAEGKTDEYKADMERLQAARKRREEEAAARESAPTVDAKRAEAAAAADNDDDDKLDARAVKALKPAQLKEHLKARGLSTQGQKKDLVARLIAAL